jgi:hypothetical protein
MNTGQTFRHCSCLSLLSALCILSIATPLSGAPSVSLETTVNQSILTAVIASTEFPTVTGISITCTFDPTRINIPDAIIYSPLSSTVIGALIQMRPDTSLHITVTATSDISPSDGTPLVTLEIPVISDINVHTGIKITEAKYTEAGGTTHSAAISSTSVHRIRLPGRDSRIRHLQQSAPSVRCLLNGRQIHETAKNLSGTSFTITRYTGFRKPVTILTIR